MDNIGSRGSDYYYYYNGKTMQQKYVTTKRVVCKNTVTQNRSCIPFYNNTKKIFGHSGIPNDFLLFVTNQFPLHVGSQMTFGRMIYPWKILERNKIEDFLTIPITINRRILHKTFEFLGNSGKNIICINNLDWLLLS